MLLLLQYVLPTDSPKLSASAFAVALGPMLWAQHKPDRFDTWSAGIVLLQLALPGLRQPRGLQLFHSEYEKCNFNLDKWREQCRWLTKRDTAELDANDGAGWELAQALLRPRSILVGDDGSVSFVTGSNIPMRIGAREAISHRYLQPAVQLEKERAAAARAAKAAARLAAGESLGSADWEESSVDYADQGYGSSSGGRSFQQQQQQPRRPGGSKGGSSSRGNQGAGGSSSSSDSGQRGQQIGSGGRKVGWGALWGGSAVSGSGKGVSSEAEEMQVVEDAVATSSSSGGGGGLFGAAANMWRGLTDKLFDIEARILKTASNTAKQTTTVKKLKQKVRRDERRCLWKRSVIKQRRAQDKTLLCCFLLPWVSAGNCAATASAASIWCGTTSQAVRRFDVKEGVQGGQLS
jgi:hypothetical protein